MSVSTEPAVVAQTSARGLLRPLAAVAVVAVVLGQLLGLVQTGVAPGGDPANDPVYDKVLADHGSMWLWPVGGIGNLLAAAATAFAVLVLVTTCGNGRGPRWAWAGAALLCLAGPLLAAGMGGAGILYYAAGDTRALAPAAGRTLLHHVNHQGGLDGAFVLPGLLALLLGLIVAAVALLRSRAVDWWLPVVLLVSTVASFVVDHGLGGALVTLPGAAVTVLLCLRSRQALSEN